MGYWDFNESTGQPYWVDDTPPEPAYQPPQESYGGGGYVPPAQPEYYSGYGTGETPQETPGVAPGAPSWAQDEARMQYANQGNPNWYDPPNPWEHAPPAKMPTGNEYDNPFYQYLLSWGPSEYGMGKATERGGQWGEPVQPRQEDYWSGKKDPWQEGQKSNPYYYVHPPYPDPHEYRKNEIPHQPK